MRKWKQKAIVQKIISYLPLSHKINYIFQKYVTRGVNLSDEYFYDRLGHARDHINSYQQYSDLQIPITAETFREGNMSELKSVSLAGKYADMPLMEIARSHCHFISEMKNSSLPGK